MTSENWNKKIALRTGLMAAVIGIGMSGAALAEEAADDGFPGTFSGSVTLASEYVFRGISLSDEDPAIQGSLNWHHDSGAYVGVWASSGEFAEGSIEADYYLGFGNEVNGVSYDVSVVYYTYPGDEGNFNYVEFIGKVGYDFGVAAVTGGVGYVPDGHHAYSDDYAAYFFSDVTVPIPNTPLSAGFHIGYTSFGSSDFKDYTEWSAGLYATVVGLNLGLVYQDTDISNFDNADSRVVFSISKSF